MELQALIQENNSLMKQMLTEFSAIKSKLAGQETDTCSPKEAMSILGITNPRQLTYFYRLGLLDRRKGGKEEEKKKSRFLYYKDELHALAKKIRAKEITIPTMTEMYGWDEE